MQTKLPMFSNGTARRVLTAALFVQAFGCARLGDSGSGGKTTTGVGTATTTTGSTGIGGGSSQPITAQANTWTFIDFPTPVA